MRPSGPRPGGVWQIKEDLLEDKGTVDAGGGGGGRFVADVLFHCIR